MIFADLAIGVTILALAVISIIKITHKLNVAKDLREELDALKKKVDENK